MQRDDDDLAELCCLGAATFLSKADPNGRANACLEEEGTKAVVVVAEARSVSERGIIYLNIMLVVMLVVGCQVTCNLSEVCLYSV
mmetsp:Transcript_12232/g.17812  ORF Transcript_12232/g.17812 Transcript_12232/m.17812 type:complete len:85 (-) Transcript_12232:121-375(-)